MTRMFSLQKLSPALVGSFLVLLLESAHALPREAAAPALAPRGPADPWVTINPSGVVQTIVPVVTTVNGAKTTLSTAPPELVATTTYVLSPSGKATTVTGSPPVATPTGSTKAGAFMFCDSYVGESPFCQPKRGTQLNPDKSYYVTWSSETFSNKSALVEIQGDYQNGTGFTSELLPVTQGYWVWKVDKDILGGLGNTPLNVTLYLASWEPEDGDGVDEIEFRKAGPTVYVVRESAVPVDRAASGVNAIAVAVPVAIGSVILFAIIFFFWRWRQGKGMPFGAFKRRSTAQGYGVRQSRSERVGGGGLGGTGVPDDKPAPSVGIQLTDRDSWSPTSPTAPRLGGNDSQQGRNVFREELRRQERQG